MSLKIFKLIMVLFIFSPVYAGSTNTVDATKTVDINKQPMLVKKIGGLAHLGQVNTCEIYANHPKLRNKLIEINELMAQAQKKGELKTIAVFVRAQIPSEEIYAQRIIALENGTVRIQRVDLESVYGTYQARTSTEAKILISLVNDICQ